MLKSKCDIITLSHITSNLSSLLDPHIFFLAVHLSLPAKTRLVKNYNLKICHFFTILRLVFFKKNKKALSHFLPTSTAYYTSLLYYRSCSITVAFIGSLTATTYSFWKRSSCFSKKCNYKIKYNFICGDFMDRKQG